MKSFDARKISLLKVLSYWQITPVKMGGDNLWYKSPLRPDEKTPSFKISRSKNLWYDHGGGEGGNVIDLVMKVEHCTFTAALQLLQTIDGGSYANVPEELQDGPQQVFSAPSIHRVQSLQNEALTAYLRTRRIPISFAQRYLKEVYFEQRGKRLFALGFENDQGGFEIRNKYYKGCLGTKAISFLQHSDAATSTVFLFEGFMDFLSYLTLRDMPQLDGHVLVLNSTALKGKALEQIQGLGEVRVRGLLDNDPTGVATSQFFTEALTDYTSWAEHFLPHKDINDYLLHVQG